MWNIIWVDGFSRWWRWCSRWVNIGLSGVVGGGLVGVGVEVVIDVSKCWTSVRMSRRRVNASGEFWRRKLYSFLSKNRNPLR